MNYELAKKLQVAGFKPILGAQGKMVVKERKGIELIDPIYAPSLEELVDSWVELKKAIGELNSTAFGLATMFYFFGKKHGYKECKCEEKDENRS